MQLRLNWPKDKSELSRKKIEKRDLLLNLGKKEKELKAELAQSQKYITNLNQKIEAIIRASTLKQETRSQSQSTDTAEKTGISVIHNNSNFAKQKQRLPWPVNGFISDRFGIKPHPILPGVKMDNNGIDIRTEENAVVSAVFEGKVLDITEIPSLNHVVAVQHGDFFTVYANLKDVRVSINQVVNRGTILGQAAKKDGKSEINFQIWNSFNKINPEFWLSTK